MCHHSDFDYLGELKTMNPCTVESITKGVAGIEIEFYTHDTGRKYVACIAVEDVEATLAGAHNVAPVAAVPDPAEGQGAPETATSDVAEGEQVQTPDGTVEDVTELPSAVGESDNDAETDPQQ